MPLPNLNLKVPAETQTKFPEIITMIQDSPSMNVEERQYWIDALPVMTDDQIRSLQGILTNEKKQLSEAEKNYNDRQTGNLKKAENAFNEAAYRAKKTALKEAEATAEHEEKSEEEKVLEELAKL